MLLGGVGKENRGEMGLQIAPPPRQVGVAAELHVAAAAAAASFVLQAPARGDPPARGGLGDSSLGHPP